MQFDKKQFMASVAPAFAIAAKQHVVPAAGHMFFTQSQKTKGQGVAIVNAGAHAVACRFSLDDYFTAFCADGAAFQTAINALPDGHVNLQENGSSVKSKGAVKVTIPVVTPPPIMPPMPTELILSPCSAEDWHLVNVAAKFVHAEELNTLSAVYVNNGAIFATDTISFIFMDCQTKASAAIQKQQVAHIPTDSYDIGQEVNSGRLWLKNDHLVACSAYTGGYAFAATVQNMGRFLDRVNQSSVEYTDLSDAELHFFNRATKIVSAGDYVIIDNGTMSVSNSLSGINLEAQSQFKIRAKYSAAQIQKCLSAHKENPQIGFIENYGGYTMVLKSTGVLTGCQSFKV